MLWGQNWGNLWQSTVGAGRMSADVPHFSYPFRRDGGKVAVVEQDTPEHVMACENLIVRCPLGFREDRPEFGWPFPEFQSVPLDLRPLEAALARFEPRGRASAAEWADEADASTRNVKIDVEA